MFFENDADYEMAALEEAGERNTYLKNKGVCTHGWWQVNKDNTATCLHCDKKFKSEEELRDAGEYAMATGEELPEYTPVDTGEELPQLSFAPKPDQQLRLI